MELRDKDKGGFVDEIIFSARLPAELIDEEDDFDSMDTNQDGVSIAKNSKRPSKKLLVEKKSE